MIFNNDRAIYLQITDYFFEQILNKQFVADSRILSVRELAVQLEVNPNTVMRTYQYLQNMGIIYNKRGIGYFVSAAAFDIVTAKRKKDFIEKEVPEFFKTMELLGISMEELNKINRKENNKNGSYE